MMDKTQLNADNAKWRVCHWKGDVETFTYFDVKGEAEDEAWRLDQRAGQRAWVEKKVSHRNSRIRWVIQ